MGAPADWEPGGKPGGHWIEELRELGTPEERERVRDGYLASVWDAEDSLASYFRFYCHRRAHQALGYRTPAEVYFEAA